MRFPVSGVDSNPLALMAIAFVISFFSSIAGLSGAFLLLPFQVSALRFSSPAVSPTNLVFNLVAIPSGVYRYFREGRMVWPLAWVIISGSIPGIIIGGIARISFFPNARSFKFFIGWVLLYMGYRLITDLVRSPSRGLIDIRSPEEAVNDLAAGGGETRGRRFSGLPADMITRVTKIGFRRISYEFSNQTYSFNPIVLLLLALVVGVIGGIYGIGGGAIIAPFIVTFFRLPIYTIAGATLLGTFATSIAGIIVYLLLAFCYGGSDLAIAPDWLLGITFGIGGFAGVYLGARAQRFVPQKIIKGGLALIVTALALRYIFGFFI